MLRLVQYLWALPYTLIGALFTPFVVATGGRAHVLDGVLELYGPLPEFWLRRVALVPNAAAITIGHVVLARDRDALEFTRAHERAHVRQYERWGLAFVPAYLVAGAWALASGAGAYRGNYFERDARRQAVLEKDDAAGSGSPDAAKPPAPARRTARRRMRRRSGRPVTPRR